MECLFRIFFAILLTMDAVYAFLEAHNFAASVDVAGWVGNVYASSPQPLRS